MIAIKYNILYGLKTDEIERDREERGERREREKKERKERKMDGRRNEGKKEGI